MQSRNMRGKYKSGWKLAPGYFRLKTHHPASAINFRFQKVSGGGKKRKNKYFSTKSRTPWQIFLIILYKPYPIKPCA